MTAPNSKNELLGEVPCIETGCIEGVEYVYKNKRGLVYGICPSCGTNQRTGKNVLNRLSQYVPVGTLKRGSVNDTGKTGEQLQGDNPEKGEGGKVEAGADGSFGAGEGGFNRMDNDSQGDNADGGKTSNAKKGKAGFIVAGLGAVVLIALGLR